MRKYVAIVLFVMCAAAGGALRAAEAADTACVATIVERINASGHMQVHHPAAMDARLQKAAEPEATDEPSESRMAAQGRAGYRIQVFDDNDPRTARTEAQNRKRLMDTRFPEWHSYVQFNSPYWRVKVGDFRSRAEADGAIEDMRRAFPYMSGQLRIVRDRINVAE